LAFCAPIVSAQQPVNVQSPEIGADRRVTFRLNAPKAQEVALTGEFLKGETPLVKGADGVWTVTVGPIEPEIYHYNFTVDGLRIIDPANPNLKTGSTASTLSSVLEVRGDAPSFYDAQNVPHGEIHMRWYHSKSLDSLRRLTVYTPPRYDRELRTRYPVVYLLHGANADFSSGLGGSFGGATCGRFRRCCFNDIHSPAASGKPELCICGGRQMRWLFIILILTSCSTGGERVSSQAPTASSVSTPLPAPEGWALYPSPPADSPALRCANYSMREWRVVADGENLKIRLDTRRDHQDPLPPEINSKSIALGSKGDRHVIRVEDGWLVGLYFPRIMDRCLRTQ
jgi:hypothetical protein